MTRTSLIAAATAAAALVAFPAAASAAPTAAVNAANRTITITGDDTDEAIAVAEAGGLITLNGSNDLGGANAPADGTFTLTVNAGGGADTVTITAAGLSSTVINGGAGDDSLTGGPGNDRIVGDPGTDTMAGGAGNDIMVWNPGDGNDVMDGDAGADDAELNGGGNAENFSATPIAPDRVRFERLSPGPINLNVGPTTERLVLNANGGNDTMVSDPAVTTAMLLNGGTGADQLASGGGADNVGGGDENDTLNGGPGRDRLVGDRGADAMIGAAGDDTTVWNPGDGSDVMEGQDGLDRVEVNGGDNTEQFAIAPNGARAKFDRVNPGPFSLDIGTAEVLDLRANGGDDTFAAQPGTPLSVLVDGGAGNDALTGAEEPDTFFGGAGNDTLTGGAGLDLLDGQDGDDTIAARDNVADALRGGAGTDSAQADRADAADGIEALDVPAEVLPDVTATPVDVLGRRVNVRGRRARIALECPAGEAGGCEGTVALMSRRTFRVAGNRVRILLGSARFDIAAGERERVTVRLSRNARRLAQQRRLPVVAQTLSEDAAGNLAQGSKRLTLRFPRG